MRFVPGDSGAEARKKLGILPACLKACSTPTTSKDMPHFLYPSDDDKITLLKHHRLVRRNHALRLFGKNRETVSCLPFCSCVTVESENVDGYRRRRNSIRHHYKSTQSALKIERRIKQR